MRKRLALALLLLASPAGAQTIFNPSSVGELSGLGAGVATWLATPSSANLATAVTGETGSGALVFGTSPTIAAPVFSGTATGTYTLGGTPTLSGGTLSGTTTLPGSGQISGAGDLGLGGTPGAQLDLQGNRTAAFSATAVGLRVRGVTWTDTTTGAGTIAAAIIHNIGLPTLASTNAITITEAITLKLFSPSAGSNITITDGYALGIVGNSYYEGNIRVGVTTGGTYNGNTSLTANDQFPLILFRSGATSKAQIFADVNIGKIGLDAPGDFVIRSEVGGGSERLHVFASGDTRQGTGAAIATTATDGFFLIATTAGAPTGVPTNAGSGQIPMIYDKTNNQLYIYNGGWKQPKTPAGAAIVNWQ